MVDRHLTALLIAASVAALFATNVFADHRPGNVVVIGGTLSLSGRYAEPAKRYLNVYRLYVDELNGRGGLLGHKVELRTLDDKSDRHTAIELYEKLITEDNVDLLLAPYSSWLNDAVANVMERYQRPFIASGAAKAIWERGRKYVFSAPITNLNDYQHGSLALAKEIGIRRIAIIGEGSLGPAQITGGTSEWAKKLGLEVVFVQSYRKDEKDFTALLKKVEASGAEAIFSNSLYAGAVAQLRQMRELNMNTKLFAATVAPAVPKFVKELGGTAEFALGFSQWEPNPVLGYPGMKAFIDHYEKRYGVKPNYHVAKGYSIMQVLEAAVKHVGSFDPQRLRDTLASISVETVMGRWKADTQGMCTIGGLTIQIQNGKRVIVWPKQMAEARYLLPMPRWDQRPKN